MEPGKLSSNTHAHASCFSTPPTRRAPMASESSVKLNLKATDCATRSMMICILHHHLNLPVLPSIDGSRPQVSCRETSENLPATRIKISASTRSTTRTSYRCVGFSSCIFVNATCVSPADLSSRTLTPASVAHTVRILHFSGKRMYRPVRRPGRTL